MRLHTCDTALTAPSLNSLRGSAVGAPGSRAGPRWLAEASGAPEHVLSMASVGQSWVKAVVEWREVHAYYYPAHYSKPLLWGPPTTPTTALRRLVGSH
eukprot:scaffold121721_cov57-Phaeocystis_antarctica.AAC.3